MATPPGVPGVEAVIGWQRAWIEAWARAAGTTPGPGAMLEAWTTLARTQRDALREAGRLASESVETGKPPSADDWVDLWLSAQSQAARGLLWSPAFAAASGAWAVTGANFRRQWDETMTDTLHTFGLPARRDVEEVGRRLLDLERQGTRTREALRELTGQGTP